MTCCVRGRIRYGACLVLVASSLMAQTREVSVSYLRAALDSIPDRGRIRFTAEFVGSSGLEQATGSYLRNKGFSRFTVRDPDTGLTFRDIYCEQDGSVFDRLLGIGKSRRFQFEGYKGTGEGREDAVFVTSAREVVLPTKEDRGKEEETGPRTYRVTIVDNDTSNRTVMVNVELGKKFNLMGSTLMVEEEKHDPNKIHIVD